MVTRVRSGLYAALCWLVAGCAATPPTSDLPVPAAANRVAVILSPSPVNQLEFCHVLARRMGEPYRIFDLTRQDEREVQSAMAEGVPTKVIAVGAQALALATRLAAPDVVYAGVAADHEGLRRVNALPPFAQQLDYWLARSPNLNALGVVTSSEFRQAVDRLEAAASARGLILHHSEVTSDREALAEFRAMVPSIDGFVFLPDESILSPAAIRRVMDHAERNSIEVAVYSPVMYAVGATHLFFPDTVDVANQVIDLLHSTQSRRALTKMRVQSRALHAVVAGD